jgi:hypothetical protein
MNHARGSTDIAYLSSPVTGGGVMVNRFTQLFLLATHLGMQKPVDWAEFVWEILVAQGQKIVKNGEPLNTKEENIAELLIQANTFAEKQLPIFKALQL